MTFTYSQFTWGGMSQDFFHLSEGLGLVQLDTQLSLCHVPRDIVQQQVHNAAAAAQRELSTNRI